MSLELSSLVVGSNGVITPNKIGKHVVLNKSAIMQLAPHAFAKKAYGIPSLNETLEIFNDLNWFVVDAKQRNSIGNNLPYSVVLMNPNLSVVDKCGVEAYPRMIVRGDAYKFKTNLGVYRLVCSNGLTTPIVNYGMNYDFHPAMMLHNSELVYKVFNPVTFELGLKGIVNDFTQIVDQINVWKQIDLDENKKIKYVKGVGEIATINEENYGSLLTPFRNEDEGNNLWKTFNVAQERVTRLGYGSLDFNEKLWEYTNQTAMILN